MDVVKLSREWPDFTFNNDPGRYLKEVIYLDPENPVDFLLIEQKEAGFPDTLPTPAAQRALITGVRRGELDSARELVDSHWGLVAAVAYPFKLGPLSPQELLHNGRHALMEATKTYNREEDGEFSDYAAQRMHQSLSVMIPERAGDSFVGVAAHPIEGIYQFIENVQRAPNQAELNKTQARFEEQEANWLDEEELKIVSLLHLDSETAKEIAEMSSVSKVNYLVGLVKQKLGAKTKEEAAVIAWRRGWRYDVVDIPGRERFTVDERSVAMRLHMPTEDIAEELDFTTWKVKRMIGSLRATIKPRSRAEMAILAQMHDFEPTEEELNQPEIPLVKKLTPVQLELIQRALYMQDKDIAALPDVDLSENAIASAISSLIQKANLQYNNRTALILELHEQGMEFDVAEPTVPMAEAFHAQEIRIIQRLHWEYQDIIDDLGLDCDKKGLVEIVQRLKQRVGARTHQELALMTKVFYDEDEFPAREVDLETHEWDLVKRIGARALGTKTWEEVLRAADEREQKIITVYFLTPGISSWDEAGTHVGLRGTQARQVALGGVRKAKDKLQRRFMSDEELFSYDPNDGFLAARQTQERELVA